MVSLGVAGAAANPHMNPAATPFRTFTEVLDGTPADDTLFEGVPTHLVGPLRDWIAGYTSMPLAIRVGMRLRWSSQTPDSLAKAPRQELLDVVHAMLWIGLQMAPRRFGVGMAPVAEQIAELAIILDDAGSAYKVSEDGRGLERRVDDVVTGAASQVVQSVDASGRTVAASLLRDAWRKTYGLNSDPGEAYADAVRAVEEVAIPIYLPNDSKASLGKVLAHLKQSSANYELVVADVNAQPAGIESVVEMVSLLWHGHRDRHAGSPTSIPITQESAEMALHTAITLVHYFNSGMIRKK